MLGSYIFFFSLPKLIFSISSNSKFGSQYNFLNDAIEFFANEVISPTVENELRRMSSMFSWIDDDSSSTYFELSLSHTPLYLQDVGIMASKTYINSLIVIAIYFEESFYFIVQNGEGDQPLLDVRFPDVSYHGQGVMLTTYPISNDCYWKKLTLWHILNPSSSQITVSDLPKLKTYNLTSPDYQQTYCIMKSAWDYNVDGLSSYRDVIFRFGSWCYSGRVHLIPEFSLQDIPFVIPALRVQQSRLEYLCDVKSVPTTSPFASALKYAFDIAPYVLAEITKSEETLSNLITRLSNIGLDQESLTNWLDGDPSRSFFEFKLAPDNSYRE